MKSRTTNKISSEVRARIRGVTLSRRGDADAAATSGLVAGERVVVFPPASLRDGDLAAAGDWKQ
jgi:hypothetical protein